jgi:ABC-type branched-subunit amino acid transport system substrate-binding protein
MLELGADTLRDGRAPSAIVCAADASETAELARRAARMSAPLLNAGATADVLRSEQCSRLAFHISASDAMRADALQAGAAKPDTSRSTDAATVEQWHAKLERFGAGQLNDRFTARFGQPMSSAAWAAWFAVKVAWEASQRARATDGPSIAAYLERDTAQFDGHKGVPLSFRRWDHQLRQPLYIVAVPTSAGASPSGPVITPVPSEPGAGRGALDQLGTREEQTQCRW